MKRKSSFITLLVFSDDGAKLVSSDGSEEILSPEDVLDQLPSAAAFMFMDTPLSAKLPTILISAIYEACKKVPCFLTNVALSDPGFRDQIGRVATIFDRILLQDGEVRPDSVGVALELKFPPETNPVQLVLTDLQTEAELESPTITDYDAGDHWEKRAISFEDSSRAVCYANASRRINKLMHCRQVEALSPAILRAVARAKNSSEMPSLLEYGCGIGRLVPYCAPYSKYHGVDISSTMVNTARNLNPSRFFYTSKDLENLDDLPIDVLLLVTVMHHNDRQGRLEIWKNVAALAGESLQIVFLEDMLIRKHNTSANMHNLTMDDLLDEMTSAFGGTCNLHGFQLIGYKPHDFVARGAVMELEVNR